MKWDRPTETKVHEALTESTHKILLCVGWKYDCHNNLQKAANGGQLES